MSEQSNLCLFDDSQLLQAGTEGIKYAGSKLKLIPHILRLVSEIRPSSILDGFSGSTRVSQAFAKSGYRVISNDLAVWSKVFAECYLLAAKPPEYYDGLISHLNSLQPKDGWFTENYGGSAADLSGVQADGLKKPWQAHVTRKLDAIRDEIDSIASDPIDRSVLLTSLILALDQVDNTLGHYAAYLGQWSPRSFNQLVLRAPAIQRIRHDHQVLNTDVFSAIQSSDAELSYFDPPYGSSNEKMPPSRVRYGAYYHIWTTVCLNDRPELFGKAKRRADSSDRLITTPFEEFRRNQSGKFIAVEAVERLLRQTSSRYVLLSYSSGGRATAGELHEAVESAGSLLKFMKIDHSRNVMSAMRWTNEWSREAESNHHEYLFLLEK
ncbi:MAG: DNA adenine methylase [Opitutaceae bacterium]